MGLPAPPQPVPAGGGGPSAAAASRNSLMACSLICRHPIMRSSSGEASSSLLLALTRSRRSRANPLMLGGRASA